jgi:hypothetical protein
MEELKFCYIPQLPFLKSAAYALSARGKQWKVGEEISVSFMGGTKSQINFVKEVVGELLQYANITFKWETLRRNSDIRVSFNRGGGSWSYVGTDALFIAKNKPTMNLGWLDRAVVLHEFGHALSLLHEHSNPNGGIEWNEPAVIRDLSGPPNRWNLSTIRLNVLDKVELKDVMATRFDPKSIMLYHFPASWTKNNVGTNSNKELSEIDKQHLRELYPFKETNNRRRRNILHRMLESII